MFKGGQIRGLGLPGRPLLNHSTSAVLMKRLHHLRNAGRPAALETRLGAGRCICLGTVLEESGLKAFLAPALEAARVR